MGIFAVAALTRLLDKHVNGLIAPVCGTPEGKSASNSIQEFTAYRSKKGHFMKRKAGSRSKERLSLA
jgi:hypothetical protein